MALVTSTREEGLNGLPPAENDTKVESAMEGENGRGQVPDETEVLAAPKLPDNRAICPKCQGRSVCLVSPAGNASCFCPPDRTGEFCEVGKPSGNCGDKLS